ncbi:hypothetical protein H181DRAFT_00449 [Streptomyces sp. WMMB 714]|uniref:hypothetical protein n=1 Tax=Streptomyces sp. WMMB 714 TaxID=1286822 RepID=UPI0005F7D53A|nr:hypothetical protein [Streptomyces sp. WMMB 714]SCK09269.1 hypothetical protein H181DRAFT_00449 [Streptomyces sp. WMMB 714]
MDPYASGSERITLMAVGEFRAALDAFERGEMAAAVSGLMAIDTASWQAIESRLAALGGSMPELLTLVRSSRER